MLWAPSVAFAQTDNWEINIAPLYLWAATNSGHVAINGTANVPVYMDFSDAASKLTGAFSFYGEARKGRWGVIGNVDFIRLSTDANFTTPIVTRVAGSMEFDQTIFRESVRVGRGRPALRRRRHPPGHPVSSALHGTDRRTVGQHQRRRHCGDRRRRIHLPARWAKRLLTQRTSEAGQHHRSAEGGIQFEIAHWIGVAAGYRSTSTPAVCPRTRSSWRTSRLNVRAVRSRLLRRFTGVGNDTTRMIEVAPAL
jgi:hypothetical protein